MGLFMALVAALLLIVLQLLTNTPFPSLSSSMDGRGVDVALVVVLRAGVEKMCDDAAIPPPSSIAVLLLFVVTLIILLQ
jgi:hypothetical protein